MRTYDIEIFFMDGTSRKFNGCKRPVDAEESSYGVMENDGKTVHIYPIHRVCEIVQVRHDS
ncbi:hypothetical protein HWB76_gp042 [Streptomyces phage Blueeyedbeauty]|uniref:Uncharacterized protein n=1 Tax=Streptomyces phage Blueeyedbeauty TaxID=2250336 RepID=A0A345L256_9CAUD|nr:hypothetical protein HWB76_gp042 [Streptomyces phage Blueeyedbeauty]AXH49358.1 hypothetical protein SEA_BLUEEYEDBEAUTY_251 [Streptomyces phage Blueeyedbeauty]